MRRQLSSPTFSAPLALNFARVDVLVDALGCYWRPIPLPSLSSGLSSCVPLYVLVLHCAARTPTFTLPAAAVPPLTHDGSHPYSIIVVVLVVVAGLRSPSEAVGSLQPQALTHKPQPNLHLTPPPQVFSQPHRLPFYLPLSLVSPTFVFFDISLFALLFFAFASILSSSPNPPPPIIIIIPHRQYI